MSPLKVACSIDNNVIKAGEKVIKKLLKDSNEKDHFFFSVTDSYKEPNLVREIFLKETGGNNLIFGIISSGSIITSSGFYEKGVIGGRLRSDKIRIEPVLIEGGSKNLYQKIKESLLYLHSRKNGDDLLILIFVDDGFYYRKSLFKHIVESAEKSATKVVGGFIGESKLNSDESGIFYNTKITEKSMLLLGLFKKESFSVSVLEKDENFSREKRTGSILLGQSFSESENVKKFLPKHPFLGIGTTSQFYYLPDKDSELTEKTIVRVDL